MQYIRLIGLLLVLLPVSLLADSPVQEREYQWEKKRDKRGIKVYTSPVIGSRHQAVRAETTARGTVAAVVGLIDDTEACPRWAILCADSRLLDQQDARNKKVYVYNDVPFPTADRDLVIEVSWVRDKHSAKISMYSKALKLEDSIQWVAKKKRVVRVVHANSQWHITPQGDGRVHVESIAHIDPNGAVPAWMTNLILVNSPFKSMKRLREIVESGEYDDYQLLF